MTVRERFCLKKAILWGNELRIVAKKTESRWWLQIKQIDRWYLYLVISCLHCITLFKCLCYFLKWKVLVWYPCGVLSCLYNKMVKRRTLETYSLRYNIKKSVFSVLSKLKLFNSGRRESSHTLLLVTFLLTLQCYFWIFISIDLELHHLCFFFILYRVKKLFSETKTLKCLRTRISSLMFINLKISF